MGAEEGEALSAMVGLAFRFDLGRYHATPWGSHVNEGAVEWPPSPWRILRSLYAVSRWNATVAPWRAGCDAAVAALAAAGPPSYELPPTASAHTRHYLPSRDYSPTATKKTDKVLDGFLALDPAAELVVWWEASLAGEALDGLAAAAAALGHLGRSESVCSARVVTNRGEAELAAVPVENGTADQEAEIVRLLCPAGDDPVSALTASITDLRRRRLLLPPGAEWVEYAVRLPGVPAVVRTPAKGPTLARFRIHGGSRPALREAVAVAHAARAALQALYGRRNDEETSAVLSGRAGDRPRDDQHRHAHYLLTPDRDGRRVDHLAVWAPEGLGPGEVAALAGLRVIRLREAEPLRVVLTALGDPEEMTLPGLLGPAASWRSLTPFALNRHPKTRGGAIVDGPEDQIRRELRLRGFPEPVSVALVRGPWLEHRRTRPGRSRLEAPRAVGAQITFAEPVRGPIALGALSHFGLGLFVPAPDG